VTPDEADAAVRPVLRVISGNPSAEELAALIAVVAARGAGAAEPDPAPPSPWTTRASSLRRPLVPGPGAWRASGLPSR
jgi:hypothetical protein